MAMGRYAASKGTCRHELIATHFSEPTGETHTCDVCKRVGDQLVEMDFTEHAKALAAVLVVAKASDEDLTVLKLIDKWKTNKEHNMLAKALSKEVCEELIVRMAIEGYFSVYIKFTSYTCNAYVKESRLLRDVVGGSSAVMFKIEPTKLSKRKRKVEVTTKCSAAKKKKSEGNRSEKKRRSSGTSDSTETTNADQGVPKVVAAARVPNLFIGRMSDGETDDSDDQDFL